MTSHLGLRLLALALPAALLVPGAAHARSLTVVDSTGDAKAFNMGLAFGELFEGTSEDGPFFLDAPAETSVDVVSTTIDHATRRLTLTMAFGDLVELGGHSVEFRIFTPDGRYDLVASYQDGRTQSLLLPARGHVVLHDEDGTVTVSPGPRPCRTVRARYDASADSLTASVPTSCLGAPKWVQVAAGVNRINVTPLGDGSANVAAFADDAFRDGVRMGSLGRSPKVRRG